MNTSNSKNCKGQAAIVMVLVVSIVVLMFTHISVLGFANVGISNEQAQGEILQMKTEGYLENAAMRYLRDGTYTGETLLEDEYSCTMVVTDIGGFDRDFETTCSLGDRSRTVGMTAVYIDGIFEFSPVEQR